MKRVNRSVCSTLEETFQEYTGVIHYTCKRMSYLTKNSTETYDDLFQIASLAFMKAFEQFNEEKGKNFVTFSIPYMEGYIKNYFRDSGNTIKFPSYFKKVWKYAEKKDNGCFDVEYISKKAGEPISRVNEALKYIDNQKPVSLDEFTNDCDSEYSGLKKKVDVPDSDDFSQHYVNEFLDSVGYVNEEWRKIIFWKLKGYTQTEIGEKIGISQSQVGRHLQNIRSEWEKFDRSGDGV